MGVKPVGTIRSPKTYTIHPEYDKRATYDSDIALIELDSALEYTDFIRPICLKSASYNDKTLLEPINKVKLVVGKVAGCGLIRTHVSQNLKVKYNTLQLTMWVSLAFL